MIITVFVYIKKVSHLPSQLGIFVFTFTVKGLHIYGALLHLALKVFTFSGPYYIFTFRGATPLSESNILDFFSNLFLEFAKDKNMQNYPASSENKGTVLLP